jgi:hypothetical protein
VKVEAKKGKDQGRDSREIGQLNRVEYYRGELQRRKGLCLYKAELESDQ